MRECYFCVFLLSSVSPLPSQDYNFLLLLLLLSKLLYLARAGVREQIFSHPGVGISFPYVSPNFKPNLTSYHFIISPLAQTLDSVQTERCNEYSSSLSSSLPVFRHLLIVFCREHSLSLSLFFLPVLLYICFLLSSSFIIILYLYLFLFPPSLFLCSTHFLPILADGVRGGVIELERLKSRPTFISFLSFLFITYHSGSHIIYVNVSI